MRYEDTKMGQFVVTHAHPGQACVIRSRVQAPGTQVIVSPVAFRVGFTVEAAELYLLEEVQELECA